MRWSWWDVDKLSTWLDQVDGDGSPITSESNPEPFGEPEEPTPGRRCPSCLEKGDSVWVIPGQSCPICGTPVN
jgi:hypothetical protein